jgi:hypothetical protein
MASDNEIIRELADWFIAEMRALAARQLGDQCELLLCASDLGVDTPRIRHILARIEAAEPDVSVQGERLLDSMLRQLVYFRFGAALESRARFLDYWVNQRRFKGKDMFSVSLFVNLALQQQEFLTDQAKQYARTWYLRHPEIRAIRVRAWAAQGLNSAGLTAEAKRIADEVVSTRQQDGSWDHDVRRTLGTVYPLLLSGQVEPSALSKSLEYALPRIGRGYSVGLGVKATAIKCLTKLGWLPQPVIQEIRQKICLQGGVFLSHTATDKPAVRKLADDLRSAGVRVWIDEAEIRAGDSLMGKIQSGIEEMECLAVALSPQSVKSAWVQKELNMALVSALSDRSIRVIPLLLETCSVPLCLRDLRWIDFRSNYEQALDDFLRAVEAQ